MVFHQLTFATKISNRKSNYKRTKQKCSATLIINYLRRKYIITVIYQIFHYNLLWQIKNYGKSHIYMICSYLYICYLIDPFCRRPSQAFSDDSKMSSFKSYASTNSRGSTSNSANSERRRSSFKKSSTVLNG